MSEKIRVPLEVSKDLTIILPSYLEEENLRLLLPRINDVCKELAQDYEVLVIDTEKALDGTAAACRDCNAIYLNRSGGNTYGAAIRSGISAAKGKKIIFMDADGSHHPEFLKNLYHKKDEADIVIASRYIEGGHTENKMILVLMSKIVNFGYSLILNIKCKDVSNSFRLYEGVLLRELTLQCNNFDIVEEILFKINRTNKNLKILEIPFSFKQRMFGETKRNLLQFIFTYIFTLIRLRFFIK